MDYFQGVVAEYLRADRAMFINTECLIQLNKDDVLSKGTHWYCDIVAAHFGERTLYLCEVTYSTTMQTLLARLQAWSAMWQPFCGALQRDCRVPSDWNIQPWLFIPEKNHAALTKRLIVLDKAMPMPRITYLESVLPWKYQTWDRKVTALADAEQKPDAIQET
jgi:hypothetical protein